MVQVQPDGRYSFKSVRPGKYLLSAFDPLRMSVVRIPTDMVEMAEKGEEIEIQESARINKDVHLPKENANAAPNR